MKIFQAKLNLAIDPSQSPVMDGFVSGFLNQPEFAEANHNYLKTVLDKLWGSILSNNLDAYTREDLQLTLSSSHVNGALLIQADLNNGGRPIIFEDLDDDFLSEGQQEGFSVSQKIDRGQHISLKLESDQPVPKVLEAQPSIFEAGELVIRPLEDGEEVEVARLFFDVYGYSYIHSYVYNHLELARKIKGGDLVSFVAVLDGKIIGHLGIVRHKKDPLILEAALGVVDPRAKAGGVFGKMFKSSIDYIKSQPIQFCIYDFVTNHDYSQKLVAKYGFRELAIDIGSQSPQLQAKMDRLGLGEDSSEMDRYSLLIATESFSENPFGKHVYVPSCLSEIASIVLPPLGLQWHHESRFSPLAKGGQVIKTIHNEQKSIHFTISESGSDALRKVLQDWSHYAKLGFEYASVDVDLGQPGLGQIRDVLASYGFFIGGFVPFNMSRQLGFRFQTVLKRVAFDHIKIATQTGQQILQLIRQDYEQNKIL